MFNILSSWSQDRLQRPGAEEYPREKLQTDKKNTKKNSQLQIITETHRMPQTGKKVRSLHELEPSPMRPHTNNTAKQNTECCHTATAKGGEGPGWVHCCYHGRVKATSTWVKKTATGCLGDEGGAFIEKRGAFFSVHYIDCGDTSLRSTCHHDL